MGTFVAEGEHVGAVESPELGAHVGASAAFASVGACVGAVVVGDVVGMEEGADDDTSCAGVGDVLCTVGAAVGAAVFVSVPLPQFSLEREGHCRRSGTRIYRLQGLASVHEIRDRHFFHSR